MTTEAKLKKLEEDQIIMEDQNCKLAKVRPSAWEMWAVQNRSCVFPRLLTAALWLLLPSGVFFLGVSWPQGSGVVCEGMFLITEWGPRERFDISPE